MRCFEGIWSDTPAPDMQEIHWIRSSGSPDSAWRQAVHADAPGRATIFMTGRKPVADPIFVDTNVWVYAVDAADPAKRERALDAVASGPGRDLVVSTQVLTEFFAVVTRKLVVPVPVEDAEAMVRQLSVLPVVAIDASLVVSAVAGSREWQISIWDALILRAAEIAGCRRVLSEDLADGTTYGSVIVENPFADLR